MERDEVQQSSGEQDQGQEQDFGNILASWQFPGHEEHVRGLWWYLIAGAVVLAVLFYAYIDNNPLLAIIIVLGVIVFIVTEMRGIEYQSAVVTEDGLIIGDVFYPYDEIKSFYIVYRPPETKTLYIEPRGMTKPRLGIPLESQDPVAVRTILLRRIPENLDKDEEPISDFIGRIFKF